MLLVGMSKSSSGSPGTLEMLTQKSFPVNLVFERRAAREAKVEPGWKVASGRRSYESVPMTDRGRVVINHQAATHCMDLLHVVEAESSDPGETSAE
jgi:hypothetical protein